MYEEIGGNRRQQELEERILRRWQQEAIFRRSQERRRDAPRFTFYEGPPTANGLPGIHHVIARTLKDVVCRYHDLAGSFVERKAGWDTHGLPVEVEVEKSLGIHGKQAISEYGQEAFAERCRESVFTYVEEWERLTDRIGYWLDMEDPYVTYHQEYVESVWWALKELHAKGLLYKSHKVVWWWPQGGTALSAGEVGYGYRETRDPSVTVRFRLREEDNTWNRPASLLAWTTTPWTLPSNVALAVGPELEYLAADLDGEVVLLAADRAEDVLGDREHRVLERLPGSALVGRRYEPLFTFARPEGGRAYEVVPGDFVTTDSGTGVVHIAPGFGEDDTRCAREQGLGFLQLVRPDGTFPPEVTDYSGRYIKDADPDIIRDLQQYGLVFESGTHVHEYPFCWRAPQDPLIQYARESWFLATSRLKEHMLRHNDGIGWHPDHIREGRFGDFLRNNVDWALSRERFWGTPLPVWINDETGETDVVGSVAEILERNPDAFAGFEKELSRRPDLNPHLKVHKPWIDRVTWTRRGVPGVFRRVPDVIDCWFDSGAMPFAQRGYPHKGKEAFEASFPADFICEGLDQTRGWFYSLLAISTLLFDRPAYRNVVVNGLVLDKHGKKMSKSLGNTVDPWDVIRDHGADPLRWYLLETNPPWISTRFDPEAVGEVARRVFGTLWPSYNFLAMYASIDGWRPGGESLPEGERTVMDRWLLSRTASVLHNWRGYMEAYDPTRAARLLARFITDELSNWYIRRSRPRFWKSQDARDKAAAYDTLHRALDTLALMLAPLVPMSADALHLGLHPDPEAVPSVHCRDLPDPDTWFSDPELERRMDAVIQVVGLGRAARKQAGVRVRQPLPRLLAATSDPGALAGLQDRDLVKELCEELNVKHLELAERSSSWCRTAVKPNLPVLGPRLGRRLGAVRRTLEALDEEQVERFEREGRLRLELEDGSVELQEGDLLVERHGREGFTVSAAGSLVVALDTRLTPELEAEGLRRELMNRLQNHRKREGYDVTTRIRAAVAGPPPVVEAVSGHEEDVGAEVLARELRLVEDPRDAARVGGEPRRWELCGHEVWIATAPADGAGSSP